MPQTRAGAARNDWLQFCRSLGEVWRCNNEFSEHHALAAHALLKAKYGHNTFTLADALQTMRDAKLQGLPSTPTDCCPTCNRKLRPTKRPTSQPET